MAQSKAEVIANAIQQMESMIEMVEQEHLESLDKDCIRVLDKCKSTFRECNRRMFIRVYNDELNDLFSKNIKYNKEHKFENDVKQFIENNRDKKICIEFKEQYHYDETDRFVVEDAKDIIFEQTSIGLGMVVPSSWQAIIQSCVKRVWVVGLEN